MGENMQTDKCKINSRIEAILLYLAVILLMDEGMCNEFPTKRLWVMAIVMYGILYVISRLGYKVLLGILLISVGTSPIWIPRLAEFDANGLLFADWLLKMNEKNQELHNSIYSYMILVLVCYLAYLVAEAFVAVHKAGLKRWTHTICVAVRGVMGIVAVGYGIWMFVSNMEFHRDTVIVLFLLCFYVCLNYKDHVKKFSWMERVLLPCVLALVLAFAPTGQAFTEIQKRESYQKVHAVLTEILPGRQGFYFGYTGFGTEAKLKDSIIPTYNDALTVTSKDGEELGNFYLIGNVWDSFSENHWEKDEETAVYYGNMSSQKYKLGYLESELDQLETYIATRYLRSWDGVSSLIEERKIKITYDDVYTSAAFYPLKTIELDGDETWHETKSGMQFSWLHGNEDSYEIEFYNVDWEMLRYCLQTRGMELSGQTELQTLAQLGMDQMEIDSIYMAMQYRRNEIQKQYTKLPEDFSEKLVACAKEITSEADTPYEKAKLLESFFKEFEYNTNPPITPSDDNFLERFVLESKSGYCTYYATAMTLMCRSVGIPARYVQGFVVRGEGKTEVTVSDSDSHAWTEIYIEGVGWCPLEPTPGYSELRYNEIVSEDGKAVSISKYMEKQNPKEAEKKEEKTPENNKQNVPATTTGDSNKSSKPTQNGMAESSDWSWLVIVVAILLVIIGGCCVCFRKKRNTIYAQYGEQTQSILVIKKLMRRLKKKGYVRKKQETFREFTESCSRENEAWKDDLHLITNVYEKIVYGEKTLSAEEAQELADAVDRIK